MLTLIHIGDRFYLESKTIMSSLYSESGQRYDYGFLRAALREGETVTIRQATPTELAYYEAQLQAIRERTDAA